MIVKVADRFYLSKEWKALRQEALRRDKYLCQHCHAKCLGKKYNRPSPHVDHIKPIKTHPELRLELSNTQTLCHSCHSKITHYKPRPEIGLDGYPK